MAGRLHRWHPALLAVLLATALSVALTAATSSRAFAPPSPWDGSNPFNCTIQDAAFGPTGPDPGADPYCIHFDKTHQNVTQLGVVDFLLKEPARTAAAMPKCFYFQEDHWRGSVVQSDGRTVIYEFEGHYFFNKATGDGGAWVTDFTLAGRTFDPTALPGFPPGYGRYFGPGTGGFITHNQIPTDPQCAGRANGNPGAVYAQQPGSSRCVPDSGPVDRRGLGPVALGTREGRIRAELGPPKSVDRGFLSYCVDGGGKLLIGERADRSGKLGSGAKAPAVILLTSARGFVLHGRGSQGVRVGSSARALRRAFAHARATGSLGGARLIRPAVGIIAAVRRGRVRYLAVYARHSIHTRRALMRYLRRAR